MARLNLGGDFEVRGVVTTDTSADNDAASKGYVDSRPGSVALEVFYNGTDDFATASAALTGATITYDASQPVGSRFRPSLPTDWSETSAATTMFIGRAAPPEDTTTPLVFTVIPTGGQGQPGPAGPAGPFRFFVYRTAPATPVPDGPDTAATFDPATNTATYTGTDGWATAFPTAVAPAVVFASFAVITPADTANPVGAFSSVFEVTAQGPAGPPGETTEINALAGATRYERGDLAFFSDENLTLFRYVSAEASTSPALADDAARQLYIDSIDSSFTRRWALVSTPQTLANRENITVTSDIDTVLRHGVAAPTGLTTFTVTLDFPLQWEFTHAAGTTAPANVQAQIGDVFVNGIQVLPVDDVVVLSATNSVLTFSVPTGRFNTVLVRDHLVVIEMNIENRNVTAGGADLFQQIDVQHRIPVTDQARYIVSATEPTTATVFPANNNFELLAGDVFTVPVDATDDARLYYAVPSAVDTAFNLVHAGSDIILETPTEVTGTFTLNGLAASVFEVSLDDYDAATPINLEVMANG